MSAKLTNLFFSPLLCRLYHFSGTAVTLIGSYVALPKNFHPVVRRSLCLAPGDICPRFPFATPLTFETKDKPTSMCIRRNDSISEFTRFSSSIFALSSCTADKQGLK